MAASIVSPNLKSNKYFAPASAGTVAGGNLTILATAFVDDNGNAITAFPNHAYYSLYINGLIQENGVATVTSSQIVISGGGALDPSDPIFVELGINF
ncbi:DUF4183 domain-containing protein [Aneurinibacillus sp. Ricciae_BoGa-3]|uniref:DUF4183 domain-containing protein n=1 Tax=Aneurinibacillus sp. Ricciae_BoGa-3 TaxID=3022697 RepID=UPI002342060F|nr:DUF4183 domain-containing protein [Aneurinibacillus sp. Ricciae_BoGa-3]WCK55921.1 DUF4183 domain-containing protein [Aneurinibacillus sp. Ricciae_BoGa-3]